MRDRHDPSLMDSCHAEDNTHGIADSESELNLDACFFSLSSHFVCIATMRLYR